MFISWLEDLSIDPQWLTVLAIVSVITFILSLLLIPWLVTRLPADYFIEDKRPLSKIRTYHPLVGFLGNLLKNTFGIILIIAGILMLVLPGQGILTILVGIGLSNFPGKFRLERWFAKKPAILKTMNWLRNKAKVAPLLEP